MKDGVGTLFEDQISDDLMTWVGRHATDAPSRTRIFLNATRRARFLLLSGANDYRQTSLQLYNGTLDYAHGMVGNLYDEDTDVHKSMDIYAFEPFSKMPAVKVERSLTFNNYSYVIPQPKYLLDRAITGVFYLLSDKEQHLGLKEGKQKKKCLSRSVWNYLSEIRWSTT